MEPLGNIYHPKPKTNRQHGLTKHSLQKATPIKTVPKSPMKIVTVNLPIIVLDFIDNEIMGPGKLYASRSEAVRHYVIRGLQDDIDVIRATTHTVISHPVYPENEDTFTDKYGVVWKIKEEK